MAAAEFVSGISFVLRFMISVVVGDLHVVGIFPFPSENDAPLFVDSNGMKSGELALQKLQVVTGWLTKVFDGFRFMDSNEFMIGTFLDFLGDFTRRRQVENFFALFISET